jgi:hypothetical protein
MVEAGEESSDFRLTFAFHLLSQAERSHIGPDFLYISQTFRLGANLACVSPTERVLAIGGPYGILLLMIHNDPVNCAIVSLFHTQTPLFLPRYLFSTGRRSSLRKYSTPAGFLASSRHLSGLTYR